MRLYNVLWWILFKQKALNKNLNDDILLRLGIKKYMGEGGFLALRNVLNFGMPALLLLKLSHMHSKTL